MNDQNNDPEKTRGLLGDKDADTDKTQSQSNPASGARRTDQAVSETEWRRLYDLAARVREMEPWAWLAETDIFGVRDPENDELLFISIMGNRGEHLAVAVYHGAEGLSGFLTMQELGESLYLADVMMTLRHAQAVFGDREELMPEEHKRIKTLGLSVRGRQSWPYFRGYRPGWHPWPTDSREAHWLTLALEQTLDVAPRLLDDSGILYNDNEKQHLMIRVLDDRDGTPVWTDSYCQVKPPSKTLNFRVSEVLVQQAARLPKMAAPLEVDVFPSFMRVAEKKGQRPQSPFVALAVNGDNGMIMGFELLTVEKTIDEMWSEVPERFLNILITSGVRPAEFHVPAHNPLHSLLERICQDLKTRVAIRDELPYLNEARQSLMNYQG